MENSLVSSPNFHSFSELKILNITLHVFVYNNFLKGARLMVDYFHYKEKGWLLNSSASYHKLIECMVLWLMKIIFT